MEKQEIIHVGKHVLDMEADAVKKLSAELGDDFYNAVQMLFKTKGRVIVTGMGKSGHVGKKSRQRWPLSERRLFLSIRPKPATGTWACLRPTIRFWPCLIPGNLKSWLMSSLIRVVSVSR